MTQYFINKHNLHRFLLKVLSKGLLYSLKDNKGDYFWKRFSPEMVESLNVGKYRAIAPIKQFFFPSEELLDEPRSHHTTLLGVKSCDIHLLYTADNIFLSGVAVDDFYRRKRSDTIIISVDCTDVRPSCFCVKMGVNPYPEKNFDINLSPIKEGYVVTYGSNIGENFISESPNLFQKAIEQQIHEKEKNRKEMIEKVSRQNEKFSWKNPKEIVEKTFGTKLWKENISKTCVECDGCRWVCGSCYCFLLGETKNLWNKKRTWDSCQSPGYARVAGGANPMREKARRLQNYYDCKLVYRHKNFGLYACSGCGRCIEVCPGKIDIRESLQKLVSEKI